MNQSIINVTCPGCGYPVSTSMKTCPACSRPVMITSFSSVVDMPIPQVNKYASTYKKALEQNPENKSLNTSVAMCYLKLKLFAQADSAFEKAIEDEFDNSESFFYASVSLLAGKKAYVAPRGKINQAVNYLDSAIMIEPRGIYYYFLAYIKQDYFHRKFLNTTPNYQELLQEAQNNNVSEFEKDMLFELLCVPRPSEF